MSPLLSASTMRPGTGSGHCHASTLGPAHGTTQICQLSDRVSGDDARGSPCMLRCQAHGWSHSISTLHACPPRTRPAPSEGSRYVNENPRGRGLVPPCLGSPCPDPVSPTLWLRILMKAMQASCESSSLPRIFLSSACLSGSRVWLHSRSLPRALDTITRLSVCLGGGLTQQSQH